MHPSARVGIASGGGLEKRQARDGGHVGEGGGAGGVPGDEAGHRGLGEAVSGDAGVW